MSRQFQTALSLEHQNILGFHQGGLGEVIYNMTGTARNVRVVMESDVPFHNFLWMSSILLCTEANTLKEPSLWPNGSRENRMSECINAGLHIKAQCSLDTTMYLQIHTLLTLIGLSILADGLPARSFFSQLPLHQATLTCTDQKPKIGVLDPWIDQVLNGHNANRAQYSAPPVTWDSSLYAGALQWAQQCDFSHSDSEGAYGENLAAGTGSAYGFDQGLQSWMNEAANYDYNNPGFSSDTGHFTQVVWKSTTGVACATASCPADTIFTVPSTFIVCRYSPPGNYEGQFEDNVGMHI